MTTTPTRRLLPLVSTGPHGSRSHKTCQYRCGNACDQPVPNSSGNPEFRDIAAQALARRSVLKAGAGIGALSLAGVAAPAAASSVTVGSLAEAAVAAKVAHGAGTWEFTPVAPNTDDQVIVPEGFKANVVIAWGDPVVKDAPTFDVNNQTPGAAEKQFGYNADYVGVLPHPDKEDRALLVTNHEYTDEPLMFPTGAYDDITIKQVAMASHGMSVVEIKRGRTLGSWKRVKPRDTTLNRRIHTGTKFELDGPAAGHDRLKTKADSTGTVVYGTLNNCAGGLTPWGTVLSGEENFNQYFDTSAPLDTRYLDSYKRYGITGTGTRGWKDVASRFDLAREPHEPFRFGWIVEIDPYDPRSTPRKHTMLGRFKHEGANCTLADNGQVVVYMGDDERGDYIYKFVSAGTFDASGTEQARQKNLELLTAGTLFVGKFTGDGAGDGVHDGSGAWIPLTSDTTSYVEGMSVADVLIDTRLAADKVGPTRMDRPEDVEVNPVNGKVYAALTNNSDRGRKWPADEANPVTSSLVRSEPGGPLVAATGNRNGYVLEISPTGGDHLAETFSWDLMLVCGDPADPVTYFAGYPKQLVSPISCPDNLAFDAVGNLWISTDGAVLGSHDGLFRVPVEGPNRGKVQQFLTVPVGAETCGPFITEDQNSVFIAPQHPGETDDATFEAPSSTWPHTDSFPRPGVVVVYKKK
ncbi:phosphatase [Nocardioides gansuensis]|uniref:Phosphatase n=1 Tax=Nocardioides gansuensis TaxID=2138300 RepID=A0A2T8FAW2_9ACTN|nr:PhoX family phosphatase [Nocardioides gansuensis]PVG82861.1 phosphatase [Nocardioides gansuensis]